MVLTYLTSKVPNPGMLFEVEEEGNFGQSDIFMYPRAQSFP
jgi:hypothetical protein